jgi:hypothetical protein
LGNASREGRPCGAASAARADESPGGWRLTREGPSSITAVDPGSARGGACCMDGGLPICSSQFGGPSGDSTVESPARRRILGGALIAADLARVPGDHLQVDRQQFAVRADAAEVNRRFFSNRGMRSLRRGAPVRNWDVVGQQRITVPFGIGVGHVDDLRRQSRQELRFPDRVDDLVAELADEDLAERGRSCSTPRAKRRGFTTSSSACQDAL